MSPTCRSAAWRWTKLWLRNGELATLGEVRSKRLRDALPGSVVPDNPLDLRDDPSSNSYIKAIHDLLDSQDFDALMVIH
ncbi:hypothetical protein ACNKHO_16465 [Shigella flexneri]